MGNTRDMILDIARAVCGDSWGQGLKFNIDDVAASAAYNRMNNYAKDVISSGVSANVIAREEADALRKVLNAGGNDGNKALAKGVKKIVDDINDTDNAAAKKVASNFSENMTKYETARNTATVSGYAEFLGRDANKNLGVMHTASGYFLDAEHGASRIKTAAAAGAGVAIGARLLSGGTLTQTNTGQRDIAGVPFI